MTTTAPRQVVPVSYRTLLLSLKEPSMGEYKLVNGFSEIVPVETFRKPENKEE